ncbi:hypothetical protein C2G38_2158278 [Gigaspora rosea]|uniref:Protein kinase domain-containing protein n=1 Tax=Gigaspora rosea TaxID=44941 RepID=A0A397W405_9GLOM|nr:hypothetical protein C2G38_2158278 [Gigaspora rosea]
METQGWTSGNENVDYCIKKFQLIALEYTKVIEWIPFNRLDSIRKIGEGGGGFGSVYFATWLDGIRKTDYVNERYVRTRESSSEVVLKTLPYSEESLLSLKEYEELHEIHVAGYIELHSGNILLDKKHANPIYQTSKMSTGQRPFDGYEFNTDLAMDIRHGLRPKVARETPNCYVEMVKQCTNTNPQTRPTAYIIYNKMSYWFDEIKDTKYVNEVIKRKINYWLDKMKGSDDQINDWLDEKQQINDWLDGIKGSDDVDEIKKQVSRWLSKIKSLDDVDKVKKTN